MTLLVDFCLKRNHSLLIVICHCCFVLFFTFGKCLLTYHGQKTVSGQAKLNKVHNATSMFNIFNRLFISDPVLVRTYFNLSSLQEKKGLKAFLPDEVEKYEKKKTCAVEPDMLH